MAIMRPHISVVEIVLSDIGLTDEIRHFVGLNFFFTKHINYNFGHAYNDFRVNYMHLHVLMKDNGQSDSSKVKCHYCSSVTARDRIL